jgi:hypothetical protein
MTPTLLKVWRDGGFACTVFGAFMLMMLLLPTEAMRWAFMGGIVYAGCVVRGYLAAGYRGYRQ